MNPFNILEIPRSSSKANVMSRFKHLARQHHPNKGGNPNLFIKYNAARKQALLSFPNNQNNQGSVEVPIPVKKTQPKMSQNIIILPYKSLPGFHVYNMYLPLQSMPKLNIPTKFINTTTSKIQTAVTNISPELKKIIVKGINSGLKLGDLAAEQLVILLCNAIIAVAPIFFQLCKYFVTMTGHTALILLKTLLTSIKNINYKRYFNDAVDVSHPIISPSTQQDRQRPPYSSTSTPKKRRQRTHNLGSYSTTPGLKRGNVFVRQNNAIARSSTTSPSRPVTRSQTASARKTFF
jgi:hypothetical protein